MTPHEKHTLYLTARLVTQLALLVMDLINLMVAKGSDDGARRVQSMERMQSVEDGASELSARIPDWV